MLVTTYIYLRACGRSPSGRDFTVCSIMAMMELVRKITQCLQFGNNADIINKHEILGNRRATDAISHPNHLHSPQARRKLNLYHGSLGCRS